MTSSKTILNISGVTKSFSKAHFSEAMLLRGISLEINRGQITALVGSNGAGKTTLFNMISGFDRPTSGMITYHTKTGASHCIFCASNDNSLRVSSLPPHKIAGLGIGRLFQDVHIFKNMCLVENVMCASKNKTGETPFLKLFNKNTRHIEAERAARAEKIIMELLKETFSPFEVVYPKKKAIIWGFLSQFFKILKTNYIVYGDIFSPPFSKVIREQILLRDASDFSFGQQKLLSLAMLFMGDYDLLILDEPTAGVNPKITQKILNTLKIMVDDFGKTVFMIEHNMDAVHQIADYCYFMNNGLITHQGSPKEVFSSPTVMREYLGI